MRFQDRLMASSFCRLFTVIFSVTCSLLIYPGPSLAASFDCDLATTAVENAICEDFHLSVDDRVLNFLYSQRLSAPNSSRQIPTYVGRDGELFNWFEPVSADEETIGRVRQDQSDWLKYEREACGGDIACLRDGYSSRIDQLLQIVRLERPGSGNRINLNKEGAEKELLRLWASIFENIDRHGLFPQFVDGAEYFALNGTAQYLRSEIASPIFHENDDPNLQGPLDWGVNTDYNSLIGCIGPAGLSDIHWWGRSMYLDTFAQLNDCLEMYWVERNQFGTGEMIFPRISTPFSEQAEDQPFRLAYAGLCGGFIETRSVCSDPSRRILIETVESMAAWSLAEGNIDENTLRELLWPWKENNLFQQIADDPYDSSKFERSSLSLLNTLSHMRTFPNDLDFGRCRFNADDVMVCPTLSVGGRGSLRISGATDICRIGDFEYQLKRSGENYFLSVEGPPFDQAIEYEMTYSMKGTGPCTYSFLASTGSVGLGGQIEVDFGPGCFSDDQELPKTMSVIVNDFVDGPIPPSVLNQLAGGNCELQVSGEFGGRF